MWWEAAGVLLKWLHLFSVPSPFCGGIHLLSISGSTFGPTVSRKKPCPPLKPMFFFFCFFFFCNFKCISRKPSFMAIIAQLITLWRLQTCVIYIFLSSHLAHRLENASMWRVNLAVIQPSLQAPLSKPFLSWSWGAMTALQAMLSCPVHSDDFPTLPVAPHLAAAFGQRCFPSQLHLPYCCRVRPGWSGTGLMGAAIIYVDALQIKKV